MNLTLPTEDPLWSYIAPILIPTGVTENIISLLVLRRKRFADMPCLWTLMALSVTDTLVLLFGMSRYWMSATMGIHPHEISWMACPLLVFINFTLSQVSSLLVAFVSLERMCTVCFSYKFRGVRLDRKGMPLIYGCCFFVNFHLLFTSRLQLSDENATSIDHMNVSKHHLVDEYVLHKYICITNPEWASYLTDTIDSILLSFLPFFVIIVCNTMLFRHMRRTSRTFVNRSSIPLRSSTMNTTIQDCVSINLSCTAQEEGTMLTVDKEFTNSRKSTSFSLVGQTKATLLSSRISHRETRVTKMLLLVSCTFFLCNFPFGMTNLLLTLTDQHLHGTYNQLWLGTYILVYINNCLNFPIYLITNPAFRKELLHLHKSLCCSSNGRDRRITLESRVSTRIL